MSNFKLSTRSRNRMKGVHEDLVAVVERAIKITEVDFVVLEGVRSYDRQRQLRASGATKTMNSRHLTGHAVDLGALVDGEVLWDWHLYYEIAKAMRRASIELKTKMRWGGVWDKLLSDISPNPKDDREYYCKRRNGSCFTDGPHYELDRKEYPAGKYDGNKN